VTSRLGTGIWPIFFYSVDLRSLLSWLHVLDPSAHKVRITYIIKSTTVYVPLSELGLSQPLSRQRVCPSPQNRGGGAHSPAGEGLGKSNSDDWRKNLALCLYSELLLFSSMFMPATLLTNTLHVSPSWPTMGMNEGPHVGVVAHQALPDVAVPSPGNNEGASHCTITAALLLIQVVQGGPTAQPLHVVLHPEILHGHGCKL
jgi:hypothetical protein